VCKWSINSVTNPSPVYSHRYYSTRDDILVLNFYAIHTSIGIVNILTQGVSSVRLPTYVMTAPGSQSRWTNVILILILMVGW
jgi:hypothetical protein